ncbi:MAG: hypothetical protein CMJ49_11065 [Planctomycetaceae bacterium]|nr:hypothetical protein [Planctomycetaceae bacterium]
MQTRFPRHWRWITFTALAAAPTRGTVTNVLRDEQLLIAHPGQPQPTTIRLAGIRPFPDQTPALEQWLNEHLVAQPVEVVITLARTGDRAAPAAHLYLRDGTLVNERLIESGIARTEPHTAGRLRHWLRTLENRARFKRVGLWALTPDPTHTPPPAADQ